MVREGGISVIGLSGGMDVPVRLNVILFVRTWPLRPHFTVISYE